MFTGIVQGVRTVTEIHPVGGITQVAVDLGDLSADLALGGSVAFNGACVTAAARHGDQVRVDLIRETLELTNLGELRVGSQVNVERSLRYGDEVGGHVLSGHVATMVPVTEVEVAQGRRVVTVVVPRQWMRYLMLKGFVALNGASLTIARLDRERSTISVSLIPETLSLTTFAAVAVGDRLNLEVDAQTQAVVDTVRAMLPELVGAYVVGDKPPEYHS